AARRFSEPEGLGEALGPSLTHLHRQLQAGTLTEAYLYAVELARDYIDEAPMISAALTLALQHLEREGLPHTLSYEVALPEEQRLILCARVHGELAQATAPLAGFEALSRAQWRAARVAIEGWMSRMQGRAARGGRRPEDVEYEAELAIWRAAALQAEGDAEGAFAALDVSLRRARREAFNSRALSARVLKEAGDLRERQGRPREAIELHRTAFRIALPGIKHGARLEALALGLDEHLAERCARSQSLGVQISVALARLEGLDLEWARGLLALSQERFHIDEIARLTLLLELTSARARPNDVAAGRALEAALSLDDPEGLALAHLYLTLSARHAGRISEAIARAEEACKAALKLSAGQIRRTVEIFTAQIYLDQQDLDRAQLHLRRAVDAMSGALPDHARPLDALLPEGDDSVEGLIQSFMDQDQEEMAYRLALAYRGGLSPLPPPETTTATQTHQRIEAWLKGRFLIGDHGGLEVLRAGLRPHHDLWPTRHLKPGQLRVTYHLSARGGLIFCESPQGLLVRPLQRTEEWLEAEIEGLLAATRRGDSAALFRHGQALWRELLKPIEAQVLKAELVLIAPDGPLRRLPFALIGDTFFLASKVYIGMLAAVDAPLPARDTPPPVAYIVGDHATLKELQLGERGEAGGFERVETRLHDALSPAQLNDALRGARLLHLVGALRGDRLALSASAAPLSAARLAEACAEAGAATAVFSGAQIEAVEATLWSLLPGLSAGAIVERWPSKDDDPLPAHLLSKLANVTDSKGLFVAVGQARREAINRGIPARSWAAFEVYSAEWPRPR
ncbi:CHAT domain-containing protein, partial [Myxococcota bacterium]|nr:CHAT domain-containing protein [Myxococcota bacterium]